MGLVMSAGVGFSGFIQCDLASAGGETGDRIILYNCASSHFQIVTGQERTAALIMPGALVIGHQLGHSQRG